MQVKNYFLLFIIVVILLLNACNLGVPKPDLNLSPVLSSIETSAVLTVTAMAAISSTPTQTLMPSSTPMPSATTTLMFAPTATSTQQWLACPGIVITLTDTKKGDVLHILRCEDGFKYDLGPIAKGFYAVGPNDKFLVYVTLSGLVYAARIGDPLLDNLYDLGREHIFTVFNKRVTPDFEISFAGDAPIYRLVLVEKNYNQKRVYNLPPRITQ
jgi:hypothetical protein